MQDREEKKLFGMKESRAKTISAQRKMACKVRGAWGGRVEPYMDSRFSYLNPNQITSGLA